jgi:hypothetical protein
MAKTARLVLIDRETLIEEQQLSQDANLPLAIERRIFHLAESVGLNPINFRNDPRHILIERCRYLTAEIAG